MLDVMIKYVYYPHPPHKAACAILFSPTIEGLLTLFMSLYSVHGFSISGAGGLFVIRDCLWLRFLCRTRRHCTAHEPGPVLDSR